MIPGIQRSSSGSRGCPPARDTPPTRTPPAPAAVPRTAAVAPLWRCGGSPVGRSEAPGFLVNMAAAPLLLSSARGAAGRLLLFLRAQLLLFLCLATPTLLTNPRPPSAGHSSALQLQAESDKLPVSSTSESTCFQ